MTKRASRLYCLAASLVLAAGPVAAVPPPSFEAIVDRLTDQIVVLIPFGKIFDGVAAADPAWPAQDMRDEVSSEQLLCLREELSSSGYRRYTRVRVAEYAKANRERIGGEIAVLEGGASEVFGKLIAAGAEAERTGTTANPETVLAGTSQEKLAAFISFFNDEQYAGLRELAGVGNSLGQGATPEENETQGEAVGQALTVTIILGAMQTCGVPVPEAEES
jgi:hypothetical protein